MHQDLSKLNRKNIFKYKYIKIDPEVTLDTENKTYSLCITNMVLNSCYKVNLLLGPCDTEGTFCMMTLGREHAYKEFL